MNVIAIILCIAGILALFIGSTLYASTHTAIKNQKNWDEFYKEAEKKNLPLPEEELYRLVCKLNTCGMWVLLIGMLLVFGSILLLVSERMIS